MEPLTLATFLSYNLLWLFCMLNSTLEIFIRTLHATRIDWRACARFTWVHLKASVSILCLADALNDDIFSIIHWPKWLTNDSTLMKHKLHTCVFGWRAFDNKFQLAIYAFFNLIALDLCLKGFYEYLYYGFWSLLWMVVQYTCSFARTMHENIEIFYRVNRLGSIASTKSFFQLDCS